MSSVRQNSSSPWSSDERRSLSLFDLGRIAPENQKKRPGHLSISTIAGFGAEPIGKELCLADHEWAVQQIEALKGRRRNRAARRDLPAVGTVEDAERGVGLKAGPKLVDHSTEVSGGELLLGKVDVNVAVVGLKDVEAGATHGAIELAADQQDRVANLLGLEASRRKAPKQRGV